MLESGDVYYYGNGWTHIGNLLTGPPTPALQESWGQLKSLYR